MLVLPVLLDSCVILPMPLCDTLMRAAEAGLYRVHFSQKILDDATDNLVKQGKMTNDKALYFQRMLNKYFPEAMVDVPQQLIDAMTNHPRDRHVLAAAIVAKAEVIVTENLKDFPAQDLEVWGIRAWHQDIFLTYLDEMFPDKMLQIIREQAMALSRPPSTVTELLDKLEKHNSVPNFASAIRDKMHGREF